MLASHQLPMKTVHLSQLSLDLDNYRIPSGMVDDEAAALAFLYDSEDVLSAARMILRDGYFDNEVPIVIETSPDQYLVLEGNRRVSALKSLHNPELVPSHEKQLQDLLKRYSIEAESLPESIRVIVAPDREAAIPHLARLHIGLSKKRWSLDQQANFYFSLLSDIVGPEDIKARFPDVNIKKFLKMGAVRRFLQGVHFQDASLSDYVAGDKLKMSALEYAYRHQDICQRIGIAFSKFGLIEPTDMEPEDIGSDLAAPNRAVLEYVIQEFRIGNLNTRADALKRKSDSYEELIQKLDEVLLEASQDFSEAESAEAAQEVPVVSRISSSGFIASQPASIADTRVSSASDKKAANDSNHQDQPKNKRGPDAPQTKATLPLEGVDYVTNVRVNLTERYMELRRMRYKENPLATALLMRSVLETTIKHHFTQAGVEVSGELKKVFEPVRNSYGSLKRLSRTINKVYSGSDPGTIAWFNMAAHDVEAIIPPDEVYQAWKLVNPLLQHLLRPYEVT